ncbi:hypothetical protein [Halobacillus salinus]|uniref:Uncharacterized protein n=1 Tax=Halobacillus salinus TaxID=192814 RepID=A0A4Z0H683_9BACI|nr:hypothetical protein [Halobacillus salinus]TGB05344.1 hypothetical protein E4663_10245 [Halobacillus salinus]
MISSQPIIQKKRTIENNRQHYIEEHLSLQLYEHIVRTPSEDIPLQNLFDVSHRTLSGDQGFLYLHTNSGVRTFLVNQSPEEWVFEVRSRL